MSIGKMKRMFRRKLARSPHNDTEIVWDWREWLAFQPARKIKAYVATGNSIQLKA